MKLFFRSPFLTLALLFCIGSICAQSTATERPRLVVGIMIDGLQQSHLEKMMNSFDPGGFKLLVQQGAKLSNVSYNIVSAGNAADIASVVTGSVPFYNGVVGNRFYNRLSDKVQSIIADDQEIGIGTSETVSAHNLLSSTVLDELMMSFPGRAKSYAVAIQPEDAIMLGGHTAGSVAWIDDVFLKWVTTGYYREGLNRAADQMNVNGEFRNVIGTSWQPLYAISTYQAASKNKNIEAFNYRPTDKKSKQTSATILKNTPAANRLVAELGYKIIEQEQLGMDDVPDMLMLQFTVRTPNEKLFSLHSAEKEDLYLRLDKEIQILIRQIEAKIGVDKTLFFMFGNQTDQHSPSELGENNIPAGYFSANRSMSLVNTYLMALYGQERWITGYYGKNIFLNKQKIEEKKLNLREMQQTVADFMHEFEGVHSAYPAYQLLNMGGSADAETSRLRNSVHKNSIGDVIISLMPGWLEVDEKLNPVGESNAIVSYSPVCFYGKNIKAQQISTPYRMSDIAPTLSRLLNIPLPNACIGNPIVELTTMP